MVDLVAVVLAGGSGTRFWPLSREQYPKQLLKLFGSESLIQQTVGRIGALVPIERMYIVTARGLAGELKLQLAPFGEALLSNLIAEPQGRNTAAAVTLAALHLRRKGRGESIMVVLPADHRVERPRRLIALLRRAAPLAEEGRLVLFGIPPLRPESGYGYIRPGKTLQVGRAAARSVAAFVEKPMPADAARLVRSGALWNSGIFMWRADAILEEVRRLMPRLYRALDQAESEEALAKVYRDLPSVSIDTGVLERSRRTVVLEAKGLGWSDVGSWGSLHEIAPKDRHGNVKVGNVLDLDNRNSLLYGSERLLAAIGVSDLVVVDTPDATLICPKQRTQEVRRLVDQLKKRGTGEQIAHRTVYRPWGSFTTLEEGPGYKIKRLSVRPGARLSLQMHHHRAEHWVVVQGAARVTRDDEVIDVHTGQNLYIPLRARHRIENPGEGVLEIIEVQNGEYLGEDDIVRFADDYGRVK